MSPVLPGEGEPPCDAASDRSEAESISEEERVRRLFAICDADGDGFIDSQDLINALQELGLDGEVDVDDLMHQMGAGTNGKVTYDQFLQCRLSHKTEIEALRTQDNYPAETTGSPGWTGRKDLTGLYGTTGLLATSSEHSLGAASGRQESWEFDSGARDLSPEPSSLHKLIEAATGASLHAGNRDTSNLLDLANKLHLAALGSLKAEIAELHGRLLRTGQERDTLQQALATTQLERLRLVQESEERLERQSTQYEERLTELHSVIAELTRKLNRQQYDVIKEEGEVDDDEEDEADAGSRSRSDENAAAAAATASASAPTDAAEAAGYTRLTGRCDDAEESDVVDRCSSSSSDLSFGGSSSDEDGRPENAAAEDDLDEKAVRAGADLLDQPPPPTTTTPTPTTLPDAEGQQQATSLAAQNQELKAQLHRLGLELMQARQTVEQLRAGRGRDAAPASPQRPLPLSAAAAFGGGGAGGGSGTASPIHRVNSPVVVEEGPVCKVAERVRIKRLDGRERLLTGSQIASFGVRDARVAEHLVASLHQSPSGGGAETGGAAAVQVQQLELEVERLSSRGQHLRAQNDVLSLTLFESRATAERLAVLLGKYEANCVALRLALERADRVAEAFDVLVALVESEMSLLLANCQMAGAGGLVLDRTKDWNGLWKRATERRRSCENLARCLLARHDRDRVDQCDDSGRHTSTTSSTSSGAESGSGSSNPAATLEPTERKLRDVIARLKSDRASFESTIQQVTLPLESALIDPLPREVLPLAEARKMDLEIAVIMQELMAMREERSRLRAQVFLLEKERATSDAQQQTYVAQIRLLQTQMGIVDLCDGQDASAARTQSAVEPEERERRLQARVQELVNTVERVTQNAELRHQQSTELVNDVKKANATLVQLLEKAKKKYQNRLKRMEQQMVNMSERHAMQVRLLKQKMNVPEEEAPSSSSSPPAAAHAQVATSSTSNETSL